MNAKLVYYNIHRNMCGGVNYCFYPILVCGEWSCLHKIYNVRWSVIYEQYIHTYIFFFMRTKLINENIVSSNNQFIYMYICCNDDIRIIGRRHRAAVPTPFGRFSLYILLTTLIAFYWYTLTRALYPALSATTKYIIPMIDI